VWREDLA
jgi:hypothetical protein